MSGLLPMHSFVLAGGRSSRMGRDKAVLPFRGIPLIEIAVAKLRLCCTNVSILGTRDDLQRYAPVVHDLRSGIGPGAAFETALNATRESWALVVPVDVPLAPVDLLQLWAREIIEEDMCGTSFLIAGQEPQPAFSMLHRKCAASISQALDRGDRRLNDLLYAPDADDIAPACPKNVERYLLDVTTQQLSFWFSNINTPQELVAAEAWAEAEGWRPPISL